jgi:hypothetical protein
MNTTGIGIATLALAGLSSSALGGMSLFDTGPPRTVLFDAANGGNYTETFLGWSSGNLSATFPQRWTAQAFHLGATPDGGDWRINQINVDGFLPAGTIATHITVIVWSRTGQNAPVDGDQLYSVQVALPPALDDPEVEGVDNFLREIPVNVNLPEGDYYLTIYGSNPDNPSGTPQNFAWLTNADNGINLIDPDSLSPFMWRSAAFPVPGFAVYQLPPTTLMQTEGLDPNDLYNAAFAIFGVPAPATLPLLALAGLIGRRRRR